MLDGSMGRKDLAGIKLPRLPLGGGEQKKRAKQWGKKRQADFIDIMVGAFDLRQAIWIDQELYQSGPIMEEKQIGVFFSQIL